MNVLFVNYGNDSTALIQWAYENQLAGAYVVSIDTGWAASSWARRVEHMQQWASSLGFKVHHLQSKCSFAQLVKERGSFPTIKFQWCAGFLKGLTLLEWLDQPSVDPEGQATIVLARRRSIGRLQHALPEWIEESEHFGRRRVWHPLYAHDHPARDALLARAKISLLPHRSLECDPCVNSDLQDAVRMAPQELARVSQLEQEMHSQMLDPGIYQGKLTLLEASKHWQTHADATSTNLFEMGCGSPFGCGL